MIFVSLVIDVQSAFYPHFRANRRKRLLRSICKELSRGLPALGVYHSNHSKRKGGGFAPHCHLIVEVPSNQLERFLDGLPHDLSRKDKSRYFSLSPREKWIVQTDKIDGWTYVLGAEREHLPEIVYGRV